MNQNLLLETEWVVVGRKNSHVKRARNNEISQYQKNRTTRVEEDSKPKMYQKMLTKSNAKFLNPLSIRNVEEPRVIQCKLTNVPFVILKKYCSTFSHNHIIDTTDLTKKNKEGTKKPHARFRAYTSTAAFKPPYHPAVASSGTKRNGVKNEARWNWI